MSRIEEALRRRGELARVVSDTVVPASHGEETFVSPWAFREGADRQPAEIVPASNPLAAALDGGLSSELHGLSRFSTEWMSRLVVAPKVDRLIVEEFRQLAATLHQAQATSNLRVLVVTSAEPGEGKSTTAVNLALTFSESYKRSVLLIDADLRRPTLHEITQVSNARGLGETLKATGEHKLPLVRLTERLMLAPAGRPDPNPMGALTSNRMRHMLTEASGRFDWVILDAPPIGIIADSSLLTPLSDGVLLVVRANRTHHAVVQKAVSMIGRERVLGVVLNGAQVEDSPAYNHYYHSDPAHARD